MSIDKPRPLVRLEYAKAAEVYLHSLPLEHFTEATAQATQRKITLESLALVHADRPDIQYFNELLVQYPYGRGQKIRQVVPDNMVVVHSSPSRPTEATTCPCSRSAHSGCWNTSPNTTSARITRTASASTSAS